MSEFPTMLEIYRMLNLDNLDPASVKPVFTDQQSGPCAGGCGRTVTAPRRQMECTSVRCLSCVRGEFPARASEFLVSGFIQAAASAYASHKSAEERSHKLVDLLRGGTGIDTSRVRWACSYCGGSRPISAERCSGCGASRA